MIDEKQLSSRGNVGWIYGMIPLARPKRCMISEDWHVRAKPRFVQLQPGEKDCAA
jgi:hypothetical protein